MSKTAYKSTFEKPLKNKHREKRRRDKEKKQKKIENTLKKLDGVQMTQHAAQRSEERNISNKSIKKVIQNGTVTRDYKQNAFLVTHKKTTVILSKPTIPKVKASEKEKPVVASVITVYHRD